MYSAFLPFINHRADLNYLVDMMGAEISIGHSYVRGGDMPEVANNSPAGLLGADFAIENGRYRITKIYDDEEWNPDLRAPLAEIRPNASEPSGDSTLEHIEREHVVRVLRETAGVVSKAAARLGVPRTTLNALMRKLGISRKDI